MKITYRLHEVLFDIYHKIEDHHGPVHELSEPFRNLTMHIGNMEEYLGDFDTETRERP